MASGEVPRNKSTDSLGEGSMTHLTEAARGRQRANETVYLKETAAKQEVFSKTCFEAPSAPVGAQHED